MTQIVAVFVPGITGTSLIDPGPVPINVWPDVVAVTPANAPLLLSNTALRTGAPILKVGLPSNPVPLYQPLVDNFATHGFQYAASNQPFPSPSSERVLIGYGYDWRQKNETTAAALAAYLPTVVKAYPRAQLWLVAHSMGGLVCRYMIEAIKPTGFTIQGVIMLGTPHLGAPLALSAITDEADISSLLSPKVIQEVVDLPAYPSAFQLLPPPAQPFVSDNQGNTYSIYSGPVWTLLTTPQNVQPPGFGAPAASLTAATEFFDGLDYSGNQDGRPNYFLAYGSGLGTVTSFLYSPDQALSPEQQLMQSASFGGDAIVPQSSASFAGGWATDRYSAGAVSHGGLVSDAGTFAKITTWMQINSSAAVADAAPRARPLEA